MKGAVPVGATIPVSMSIISCVLGMAIARVGPPLFFEVWAGESKGGSTAPGGGMVPYCCPGKWLAFAPMLPAVVVVDVEFGGKFLFGKPHLMALDI